MQSMRSTLLESRTGPAIYSLVAVGDMIKADTFWLLKVILRCHSAINEKMLACHIAIWAGSAIEQIAFK